MPDPQAPEIAALAELRKHFAKTRHMILDSFEGNRAEIGDELEGELEEAERYIALIDAVPSTPLPIAPQETMREIDHSKTMLFDERDPIEHELKTWIVPFTAMWNGKKTFEFRVDDRNFREGDTLRLRETLPDGREYTGRELSRVVTYVLRGGMFGLPIGYVIMAVAAIGQSHSPEYQRGLTDAANAVLKISGHPNIYYAAIVGLDKNSAATPATVERELAEALRTVRKMVSGNLIEYAIVSMEHSTIGLGKYIDKALERK